MQPQLANQTLAFIAGSQVALKKAVDEIQTRRAAEKRAADMRSAALQQLIQHGLVLPEQQKEAADMLASHADTIELLKAAVDKLVQVRSQPREKRAADQGQAVEPGQAGLAPSTPAGVYDSLNGPYGEFRTGQKKASDLAYEAILMS